MTAAATTAAAPPPAPAPAAPPEPLPGGGPAAAAPRLIQGLGSAKLRRRRFETIPLRGPGAAHTATQGRAPGDPTTPVELADLISSIAEIGVLQPILAEELPGGSGPPRILVVAGERRLRACRWGAAHQPDNPHFNSIPAIICPGPLSDEERRIWQLIENLAREPLRPGEQAAALLLQRCAILTGKLLRAGRPVPQQVYDTIDPVARFAALERLREGDPACAAPWSEVLTRLGLQLSPRKARELVRAFAAMPRHLSEEMDEHKIALHTRIRFTQLLQGRTAAAEQIWAAVKDRRRPDLLPGAVTVTMQTPGLEPGAALERAEDRQSAANQARSAKLSAHAHVNAQGNEHADTEPPRTGAAEPAPQRPQPDPDLDGHAAESVDESAGEPGGEPGGGTVPADVIARALTVLRDLNVRLRAGGRLGRYDAGSLALALAEAAQLVDQREPQ